MKTESDGSHKKRVGNNREREREKESSVSFETRMCQVLTTHHRPQPGAAFWGIAVLCALGFVCLQLCFTAGEPPNRRYHPQTVSLSFSLSLFPFPFLPFAHTWMRTPTHTHSLSFSLFPSLSLSLTDSTIWGARFLVFVSPLDLFFVCLFLPFLSVPVFSCAGVCKSLYRCGHASTYIQWKGEHICCCCVPSDRPSKREGLERSFFPISCLCARRWMWMGACIFPWKCVSLCVCLRSMCFVDIFMGCVFFSPCVLPGMPLCASVGIRYECLCMLQGSCHLHVRQERGLHVLYLLCL